MSTDQQAIWFNSDSPNEGSQSRLSNHQNLVAPPRSRHSSLCIERRVQCVAGGD